MRQTVNFIRQLLDESTDQDRAEWKDHAHTILGAISSSHPTRRGVQTGIAAAFFENTVLAKLQQHGWTGEPKAARKDPFHFAIAKCGIPARILIATLQQKSGKPKRVPSPAGPGPEYIARLPQKMVRGQAAKSEERSETESRQGNGSVPRAYSFDDFDLLAVSMYSITRSWGDFRYALSCNLITQRNHPISVGRIQPVPMQSQFWTSDISTCLNWHLERISGSHLAEARRIARAM